MFNNDDIDSIKEHASTYIKMFTYENNITDKIPIHLISDSLVEKYEVFKFKKYTIFLAEVISKILN